MIENTSNIDRATAAAILFDARTGGNAGPAAIERMEAAGQRQLVESTDLPSKVSHGTDEDFVTLGFTFGEPHAHDPLFRPATLPAGWKKQAKEHAMGSAVVDEHGRERVSVFYKAAFYDRRADMYLVSVFGYLMHLEYERQQPILDDSWATVEAVAEAARGHIERELETVDLYTRPDVAAREVAYAAKRVAEAKDTIAWFEALIARIGG